MKRPMEAEHFERSYHHAFRPEEVALHSNEPPTGDQSDLREFLELLRRHALLIVLVTFVTAAAAFVVSLAQTKHYSASTTLLYTPTSTASGTPDTATEMQTIAGVATSSTILAPIASRHGLTLKQLRSDVSANVSGGGATSASQLLAISATGGQATLAAAIANEVANSLSSYRASRERSLLNSQVTFLQQELAKLNGKVDPSSVAAASGIRTQLVQLQAQLAVFSPDLTVLSPATVPTSASSPKPARNAAIGLLVGIVLGVMVGILRDRLDRRTRRIDEIEGLYHAPLLGTVPFVKRRVSRAELLVDFSGPGPMADAYRTIRTNLSLFRLGNAKKSVIIVTSAVPAEGKSSVAANLAQALSVTGKRVLAVSADLHDPALHEYFAHRLPGTGAKTVPLLQRSEVLRARLAQNGQPAGLLEVLAGDTTLGEGAAPISLSVPERARGGSLDLLANRSTFFDPAALLSSGQMRRFLQTAKQEYDVIVIDSPPLLANADAVLLAQSADVVVMVARVKHLTRNQARRAVRVMSSAHVVPTGVIVTGEVAEPELGLGYGYGYGQAYEAERGEQSPGKPRGEQPAQSSI